MKNTFKYLIGIVVVLALRFLPHPPNVEPVMATMMPFAKRWFAGGVIFTFLAMFLYDLFTGTLGLWSFFTIGTYCLLAIMAGFYLKGRNKTIHYAGFAFVGTLIYDFITGVIGTTVFFGMPMSVAFFGQIPFTMYHLAGNVVLAAVVSPLLYRWVVENPRMETKEIIDRFRSLA